MTTTELKKMISSTDFSKMLGPDVKILKYSDLENFSDLNQIIPESCGYRIVLIETQQATGHYVCLIKYNDKSWEWDDSYGLKPDQEFSFISPEIQQMLDERKHILSILLNKLVSDGGTWVYNKMKLQQMKDGINTCGRHVANRCYFFQRGYDLKQYQNFMIAQKKKSGLSYDQIVCILTKKLD